MKLFSAKATYAAIAKTYSYLTPDLWKETLFQKSPYQEYSDYLQKNHRPVGTQKQEVKKMARTLAEARAKRAAATTQEADKVCDVFHPSHKILNSFQLFKSHQPD